MKPVKKFSSEIVVQYLEHELFHTFGVPELLVSDNGSQFRSHHFNQLLKRYGVMHIFTATHAPQANASERVNRSILSAIKSYVHTDQMNCDKLLSSIACSLRSSIHSAIGTSPYYLAFGQSMLTNAMTYPLLRQLELLEDRSVRFDKTDSLAIMGDRARKLMQKQHERNERSYNLRSREESYKVGQEGFLFQAKLFCSRF